VGTIYENAANDFLELASEQRLKIIFKLLEQKSKISNMAKELHATVQEVHRNFERLSNAGLIMKDKDGYYDLTTYGKTMCTQVPSLLFLSKNRKYFETHDFGDIPMKFIQRIGALNNSEYVPGLVAVIELWKRIYRESKEYIFGMLPQIPLDLIETVIPKIKLEGFKFNYILPQKAMVPKKRSELLENAGFNKFIKTGIVERRMVDTMQIATVLNEKQATVMFPMAKGQEEADMNSVFYSEDPLFHEWCMDYFKYSWYNSKSFDESKLHEV